VDNIVETDYLCKTTILVVFDGREGRGVGDDYTDLEPLSYAPIHGTGREIA
jgi:hypothetical protein